MIAFILRLTAAPLARWIALTLAGSLAIGLYTFAITHEAAKRAAAKAETRVVTRYLKADAKETVRREAVIQKVQVRAEGDVKRIARQAAEIAKLRQEVARASVSHDHESCLGPDSVRRLAAVGLD